MLAILSLSAGGAERVVSEMANWWVARGCEVAVLTFWGSEHDHYRLDPRVQRITLDFRRHSPTLRHYLGSRIRLPFRIRETVRTFKPDAVISFIDLVNIIMVITLAGTKIPLIVSERIDPRHHPISRLRSLARRLCYRYASALVVQTGSVAGWAETVMPASRIEVIPNFVRILPGTDDLAVHKGPEGPYILAIGRLNRQKGYDVLIRAFAMAKAAQAGWRLVILGEGPERSNLERLAADLGIGDAVLMPGIVREPAEWMRQAAFFVLPSRYEGFPNALLEAMACGCAVIAADCPSGPAEIIRHNVDGLLVPKEDVGGLSAAILKLMEDKALRHRLGSRAVEVKNSFHEGPIMARWDALIRKAVGSDN
ncbi:MAG: glycosyltransferase family 4 protein [Deltaproteobacteria bacterium]|nr:glycosyltransferase family 4 protein [Deltaproteobacteria bacterium]